MANYIGQPLTRVDGRLKVTGRATYTAEHNIPNLTYATLVMSSIAKGRIASIDTAAAERAPGVLAVLTHRNRMPLAKDPMQIEEGAGPADRKLQLLQDDRVYYANQPVAIVVAETLEAAQEAAALIKVRYTVEPHSVTNRKPSTCGANALASMTGPSGARSTTM